MKIKKINAFFCLFFLCVSCQEKNGQCDYIDLSLRDKKKIDYIRDWVYENSNHDLRKYKRNIGRYPSVGDFAVPYAFDFHRVGIANPKAEVRVVLDVDGSIKYFFLAESYMRGILVKAKKNDGWAPYYSAKESPISSWVASYCYERK